MFGMRPKALFRWKLLWCVVIIVGMMMIMMIAQYFPRASIITNTTIIKNSAAVSTATDNHCMAMFTINKNNENRSLSDTWYEQLSHGLPSLVRAGESTSEHRFTHWDTRLQLMSGQVPYIPCKVTQYDGVAVGQCLAAKTKAGKSTWLAFYGDSTVRQKMDVLLDFLPPDLIYSYYLNNKKVKRKVFKDILAYQLEFRPHTFEVYGQRSLDLLQSPVTNSDNDSNCINRDNYVEKDQRRIYKGSRWYSVKDNCSSMINMRRSYSLRLTLVWATRGSRSGAPLDKGEKLSTLEEWAKAEIVPDVVVVGYSKWSLMIREQVGRELEPFTAQYSLSRPLLAPLTRLAQITPVILASQGRYRWRNYRSTNSPVLDNTRELHKIIYQSQITDSIPYLDAWVWALLKSTGIWRWDSTLPFNLANLKECDLMRDAGFSNLSFYTNRWWNCEDPHHASYETNNNEIQMLFNMLCNPYLSTDNRHCCSSSSSSHSTNSFIT
ncbi:hypothetical protein Pmani_006111 [Petrolisthes manimaculis]|uniref:Uncharacterized protein n=1 Tax=Petrolisthes manimaculis TaxID=1843537 RepID=A0AAE1UGU1_9EUCA|nr:hypothetical protein Pmani_006111 [Petrolisthes manimaculis]